MSESQDPPPEVLRNLDVISRLDQAPLVEITGIVDEGLGGIRVGGCSQLTALWKLLPWRVGDEAVSSKPLRVRKLVNDAEFSRLGDLLARGSIVKLQARLIDEAEMDHATALLEKVLATDCEDPALESAAEEIQPCQMYQDEQFGEFYLEPGGVAVAADVEWNGQEITLFLPAQKDAILPAAAQARRLWADSPQWDQRAREFATVRLLPLKNTTWLESNEPPIAAEDFGKRLGLESLEVTDTGEFAFVFDDDGMFQEHLIVVRGTLEQGFSEAELAG